MRTQRQVVDYALRRRALLRAVYSGRVGTYEVCDASPYLRNAARFHGEPTEVRCPVCRREHLTNVHYIYGDELKTAAGQARRAAELAALAMTVREVQVYVVEVCRGCGWNHLIEQYVLGRDGPWDGSVAEPAGSGAGTNGAGLGGAGGAARGGAARLGAGGAGRRDAAPVGAAAVGAGRSRGGSAE